MSRGITGSTEFRGGRWQVRVTRPDGSRPWIDLPGEIAAHEEERAHRVGEIVARRVHKGEDVPVERGETVKEYGERWAEWREKRGLASAPENESHIRVHLCPKLGSLPMKGVSHEMLEDFVTHLDQRVLDGETHWKTAQNIWSSVSVMFDDATNAKDRSLRILSVNPAVGVRPPDKGEETAKQFLYPSEFVTLIACPKVPLLRRRLYSFAVYTYARASEIVPLAWPTDIDLEHDTIHIHQGIDRNRTPDKKKATKNLLPRRITIEIELRPLLSLMHEEAGGKGRVFPVLPAASGEDGLAGLLREDLLAAGVDRPELHHRAISTKPMTFHDLRATGTTWMAVRGDDPLKIRQRAGHKTFQTTEGYIRLAEMLKHGFGEPFPPLPKILLEPSDESPKNRPIAQGRPRFPVESVGAAGFEPATSSV